MKTQFSLLDRAIIQLDTAISSIFATHTSIREYPAEHLKENNLTTVEKKHVAGLMRVNHAGEVSAQGLYQGQALTASLDNVRSQMEAAAQEEVEHLAWCEKRLGELGSRTSYLNPIWYAGSYLIGAIAGLAGDKWSLGFVIETENQVVTHLSEHIKHIPVRDEKTKAVLEQMKKDEAEHAKLAKNAGGAELPMPIKWLMTCVSKIMTITAYRL